MITLPIFGLLASGFAVVVLTAPRASATSRHLSTRLLGFVSMALGLVPFWAGGVLALLSGGGLLLLMGSSGRHTSEVAGVLVASAVVCLCGLALVWLGGKLAGVTTSAK